MSRETLIPLVLRGQLRGFVFLLVFTLSAARCAVSAGQSPNTPEALTDALLKLHGEHARAAEWQQSAIATRMRNVALSRRQSLLARIESHPGVVLKGALPEAVMRRFPAAVRDLLEEEAELDGELEILQEDQHQQNRLHYTLRSASGNYSLHFRKDPPSHLKTGARVRVRGIKLVSAVALESGVDSVFTLANALPNTFGEQRTLVILVNFKNAPAQPYTAAYAQDLVFNSVNNFLLENSYQQTFLSGEVRGWYTIDMNSPASNCDYTQIASKADAAATAAGVALANYSRKLYAFPQARGCAWWGLGL